ncbi:GntR family transcriptional regulator [Agromyces sp. SYSU T00194]|uniref:GntR family transcriptional regulator n=1 Tax=Agromyces chitinivorans TaxID=3158560 RepID=UPI0033993146
MIEDGKPIFVQVAERIEDDIVAGTLPDGGQAPSTNEIAAFYRINPATAGKGVNRLVDDGILVKRRGIGMFVADGARERLLARRRASFVAAFVAPLLTEAESLGISPSEVAALITDSRKDPTP